MKKLNYALLISAVCGFQLNGDADSAQDLHKKVSRELIELRKDFPETQDRVYRALDHVGRMYKVLKDEQASSMAIKSEVESLKGQVKDMERELQVLKKYEKDCRREVEEQSSLHAQLEAKVLEFRELLAVRPVEPRLAGEPLFEVALAEDENSFLAEAGNFDEAREQLT